MIVEASSRATSALDAASRASHTQRHGQQRRAAARSPRSARRSRAPGRGRAAVRLGTSWCIEHAVVRCSSKPTHVACWAPRRRATWSPPAAPAASHAAVGVGVRGRQRTIRPLDRLARARCDAPAARRRAGQVSTSTAPREPAAGRATQPQVRGEKARQPRRAHEPRRRSARAWPPQTAPATNSAGSVLNTSSIARATVQAAHQRQPEARHAARHPRARRALPSARQPRATTRCRSSCARARSPRR